MKNKKQLESVLKELISLNGIALFKRPSELRSMLIEKAISPTDAIAIELLLTSCPSIAAALTRAELNTAEVNALITAGVASTDLSASRVRSSITAMIDAAEIKHESFLLSDVHLNLLAFKENVERHLKRDYVNVSFEDSYEDELCYNALKELNSGKIDEATSKLAVLAESGNAYAAYELGQFYRNNESNVAEEKATHFYKIAAELGYGPAYGALARMEMRKKNPDIEKAAHYFEYPIAVSGEKGKEWLPLIKALRDFKIENVLRSKYLLILVLIMLIAQFVPLFLGVQMAHPVLRGFSILLLVVSAGLSILDIFVTKYSRQGIIFRIIEASWILLVLQIFL